MSEQTVWDRLYPTQRDLLRYLVKRIDSDGGCPSLAQIARERRTYGPRVLNSLRLLARAGAVRFVGGTGTHTERLRLIVRPPV